MKFKSKLIYMNFFTFTSIRTLIILLFLFGFQKLKAQQCDPLTFYDVTSSFVTVFPETYPQIAGSPDFNTGSPNSNINFNVHPGKKEVHFKDNKIPYSL